MSLKQSLGTFASTLFGAKARQAKEAASMQAKTSQVLAEMLDAAYQEYNRAVQDLEAEKAHCQQLQEELGALAVRVSKAKEALS